MMQRVVHDQRDLRVGAADRALVPGDAGQRAGVSHADQREAPFFVGAGEPPDLDGTEARLDPEVTPVDAVRRQPGVQRGELLTVSRADGADHYPLAVAQLCFIHDPARHDRTIAVPDAKCQLRVPVYGNIWTPVTCPG